MKTLVRKNRNAPSKRISPLYVIATYGASVKICVYIKTIVEATKVKLVWNKDYERTEYVDTSRDNV